MLKSNLPVVVHETGTQEKQCDINRKKGSPFYQLIVTLSGRGMFEVAGHRYECHEGDVMFLKAEEPHNYTSMNNAWSTGWVIFDGHNITQLLATLSMSDSQCYRLGQTHSIITNFRSMASLSNSCLDAKDLRLSEKLYSILIGLQLFRIDEKNTKMSTSDDIVEHVRQYIFTHYMNDLSLDKLATFAGVTPQYLCTIFKEIMGEGVVDYIKAIRLGEAKGLLTSSTRQVKDIATAVGFSDVSYFCSVFKKNEGMTPQQFRGK